MIRRLLLALCLFGVVPAAAQQAVRQSGNVTPGHAVQWTTNGIVQDAGTAASGSLSSLGVTNNGGPGICDNSAPITSPYNQLCLSVSTSDAARLTLQNYGGAAAQKLYLRINGIDYDPMLAALPVLVPNSVLVTDGTPATAWSTNLPPGVSLYNTAIFSTRAAAIAATIAPGVDSVYLNGYTTAGDGGQGALYTRGPQVNTGADFQSADGANWTLRNQTVTWDMFGAKGDSSSAAVTVTVTIGTNSWHITGVNFQTSDIGRYVLITGAGPGGTIFKSTITGVSSSTDITTTDNSYATLAAVGETFTILTSDTTAFQNTCNAITNNKRISTVLSRPGAFYTLFVGNILGDQVACRLYNTNGLHIDGSGANMVTHMTGQLRLTDTTVGHTVTATFSSWTGAFADQVINYVIVPGDTAATITAAVAALINGNATLTANGIGAVTSTSLGNYYVVTSPSATPITWHFKSASGTGLTGFAVTNLTFFLLWKDYQIIIDNINGTAYSGYADSTRGGSTTWFGCSNNIGGNNQTDWGCRNTSFLHFFLEGGLSAVNIQRSSCYGEWSYDVEVTGSTSDVGYSVNAVDDPYNLSFDISAVNGGRPVLLSDIQGVKGTVRNTLSVTRGLSQVHVGANYYDCTGIGSGTDLAQSRAGPSDITWIDNNSTVYGGSQLELAHGNGNLGSSYIEDTHFHITQKYNGVPQTYLLSDAVGGGDTFPVYSRNITLDGTVEGTINAVNSVIFMTAAGAYTNVASSGSLHVDLTAPSLTQAMNFGVGAKAQIQGSMPSMAEPTQDVGAAASNLVLLPNVEFATSVIVPLGKSVTYTGSSTANLAPASTGFLCTSAFSAGGLSGFCVATASGVLRDLRVQLGAAPGAGQTDTITVYKGGDSAVTCSITDGNTICTDLYSATSHSAAVTAGDLFSVKLVTGAAAAATPMTYSLSLVKP